MNSDVIPGRKIKRVRQYPLINCDLCGHLDLAASNLPAAPAWVELEVMAGRWLAQYTAPVMAKPESRPRLEGARSRNTRQAAHFHAVWELPSHTPTNSLPLPGKAQWTAIYGLSAEVQSIAEPLHHGCSARNFEQTTNEQHIAKSYSKETGESI